MERVSTFQVLWSRKGKTCNCFFCHGKQVHKRMDKDREKRVGRGGGGGTRSEKWWACAAGHWKLDPKRSREKWNLGPKRSNSVRIGSFNTTKDRFGVGGWEKIPQKDRARSCQSEKRGSKPRHICITHHIGSTPSPPPPPGCRAGHAFVWQCISRHNPKSQEYSDAELVQNVEHLDCPWKHFAHLRAPFSSQDILVLL